MSQPLSLRVGLRFSRARKPNGLLSFVSMIAMLGVMLGVAVLVVALAVMNGSINFLRGEALKSVPHLTLSSAAFERDWQSYAEAFEGVEGVLAASPVSEIEAVLTLRGATEFIELQGVEAATEIAGNSGERALELLAELAQRPDGVVLSARLASQLGARLGDEVSIAGLDRMLRRSKVPAQSFAVLGYADFGAYGGGNSALTNRIAVQSLAGKQFQTEMRLRLADVFAADRLQAEVLDLEIAASLDDLSSETWREAQSGLFGALAMEKFLTGLMLMMIVAVGAVNIVSTLVMAVSEKGPDVAILRTMGASRGAILRVFIVQGGVSGLVGTLLGALLGSVLATQLAAIGLAVERVLGVLTGNDNLVLLSHLQTQLIWQEVAIVCVIALLISLLATLYPAYRASKIEPAEVLRYE